jgi:intermediate peptidase
LQEPGDFVRLSTEAIARVNVLRKDIQYSLGREYPRETLLALDSVSNEVCSVIDAAELCRHVHASGEWRAAAEQSFATLSTFIHTLNGDVHLYGRLSEIVTSRDTFAGLSDEERIFATDLKREFESEGIHLDEEIRASLASLHGDVVGYETAIMQNIASASASAQQSAASFAMGRAQSADEARGMRGYLGQFVTQPAHDETLMLCPPCPRVGAVMLARNPSAAQRQQVWHGVRQAPAANVDAIGGLVTSRHALANALGHASYAHKVLQNRVLTSPEEVDIFLQRTAEVIRPAAERQMSELTALKRRMGMASRGDGHDDRVMPWDMSFLSNVYRASFGGVQQGAGATDAPLTRLASHLSLSSSLNRLEGLLHDLFGIDLHRQGLQSGEGWVGPHAAGIYSYRVTSAASGVALGHVYLDLFSRPDKIPAAAHFTVRCGCVNGSSWQRQRQPGHKTDQFCGAGTDADADADVGPGQLPIVALVFNFSDHSSGSGSGSGGDGDGDVSLSLHELETFFHEWGHALHSLLSRTTFQHLSGTRGPLDAVEVPSHLMEEFVRDARVLGSLGTHMPSGLAEEALAQHTSLAAVEMQTQLLFSAADQVAFGPGAGALMMRDPHHSDVFGRLEGHVARAQTSLTNLPLDDTGAPMVHLASHGHLTNYGGSYYSYPFAKMYAAQIYERHFSHDPHSRRGGEAVWQGLLQHGNSRDAKTMLEHVGGAFDPDSLLRRIA